jgi:hypothetical protein
MTPLSWWGSEKVPTLYPPPLSNIAKEKYGNVPANVKRKLHHYKGGDTFVNSFISKKFLTKN